MRLITFLVAIALAAIAAVPGSAAPRGQWREVGRTKVPWTYWQGMTHDGDGNRYFSGPHVGLWKTDTALVEVDRNPDVIPLTVTADEGYNHIGDITYHRGQVYLPLECYYFEAGNTCKTGAIGVADAETLEWEFYVPLSTKHGMYKAMWAEVSPDGRLIWTSGGEDLRDLLAYRMDDIKARSGTPIEPLRVLPRAVPESGITGATFIGPRLFVAGGGGGGQIWSIDLKNGSRTLEKRVDFIGEAEGLDDDFGLSHKADRLPGSLHWQVMPYNEEGYPTNGLDGVIYHFDRPAIVIAIDCSRPKNHKDCHP